MSWPRGRLEEPPLSAFLAIEGSNQFRPHFIGGLTDHWPQRGYDALAIRPATLHGLYSCFEHAGGSAPPAGMCCRDHAGCMVGEQDRPAIGCRNRNREPGTRCHQRISARPCLDAPRSINNDDLRRVDLIRGEQILGADPEGGCHAGAVFRHFSGVIIRPDACVEAGVDALGYAPLASEEGVADTRKRRERGSLQHAQASKPGSECSLGLDKARTFISWPMPRRPSSVSRPTAASMVLA